jgi:hypothetical protein
MDVLEIALLAWAALRPKQARPRGSLLGFLATSAVFAFVLWLLLVKLNCGAWAGGG